MAGEKYQKIEVALDSPMVSNQSPAKGDPATLLESRNTRHLNVPGTLERQPTATDSTSIGVSGVPVSLIPLGDEVAVVSKAHVQSHGAVSGALWRQDSKSSALHPAQKWSPLTSTGGGVAWAAAANEAPMAAEFCLRAGLLVGAVTYVEKNESYPFGSAPRSEYVYTLIRVLDPETGAPVVEDVIVGSSTHSSASPSTNSVIGAVPITNDAGTANQVAVWYTTYDHATTTWTYSYRLVTITDGLVSYGTVHAWTENVAADASRTSIACVTQSCEGPTRYTYIGRRNTTTGKAELVRWDCVTHAQSWATSAGTAVVAGGAYLGYGWHGFGGPHHVIDVAATSAHVAMSFRYDEGGGLTESVRVLSTTEAGTLSLDGVQVLPTTTTSGIDFYFRLGITHHSEVAGESWALTATNDGQLTGIANQLPTATPHQFLVVSGLVSGGAVAALGSSVRFHAHTSERPFTAWDASASATLRATPYVPLMRSTRGFHATENPLGQQGLVSPQNNLGSIEPDSALEIHSLHVIAQSTIDRARLHPACRVGVDRSVPASTTHSGGNKEPGRDHRRAKPLSEDGQVFAVAYLADRAALNNTPRNVRYAIVDAGHAPQYSETLRGVTYVAAGTVWTWDGSQMMESTPISLPRLRAEEFDTGSDANKFQSATTYYFNAIYSFRDDAGNIHRSQPSPSNLEVTIGGADARLKIFVEMPPTSLDGVGLRFIGAEVYGASNALALVLAQSFSSGMPIEPVNEIVGELEYRLRGPDIEFVADNVPAYWQGGELLPNCPTSMLDIEYVNDRMWGVSGEERRVFYTKPFVEGRTLEWSALNEVLMQSASRPVAVSELDGRALIFTDRDAWTVFGEGPNANGGGAFSIPQRVAKVGATDARLVLKTPLGVVFKGREGWFRLAEGYEMSVWGEEVRDLLADAYCMTLWEPASEVRVGRRDSSGTALDSLAWNWRANKWSIVEDQYARDVAVAGSKLFALDASTLWYNFTTSGQTRPTSMTTPWLRPAGLDGDSKCLECVFTALRLNDHTITIDVWTDYDESVGSEETRTWTSTEINTLRGDSSIYSLMITLPEPHARAFKFRVSETSGAPGAASQHPLALTLGVVVKPHLYQKYEGKK